ncbi:MAG TPA: hypothetical protein VN937_14200 [Blastocatellia bacterium]|nr:hypothetical protein [Blastocatellia bacterium]
MSVKLTFIASVVPVLVITTVYIIVSPGLAGVPGLSVLVAVRAGPTGGSGVGEVIVREIGPAAGVAVALTRALDGVEDADDEFGDTESAEAISIIKLVRQRMNATE